MKNVKENLSALEGTQPAERKKPRTTYSVIITRQLNAVKD